MASPPLGSTSRSEPTTTQRIHPIHKDSSTPGSASRLGASSSQMTASLRDLRDQVSGLLSQSLPNFNDESAIELIVSLAKHKYENVQKHVTSLLGEEPLGQKARQDLIDSILARILNFQLEFNPVLVIFFKL
jgi:hypothetical protein